MPAQVDPEFLPAWVRAELESRGEAQLLDQLSARAVAEGLADDEAELDAAGQIAERRGWLDGLERAAGDLWLSEVREARGASERLLRSGPGAVAFLRASAGAAERLAQLALALKENPGANEAELMPVLGGSPGCSVR